MDSHPVGPEGHAQDEQSPYDGPQWSDASSGRFVELADYIERVGQPADLATYIDMLREFLLDYPEAWENPTLERFLDALGARLRSNRELELSWSSFAEALQSAVIYE